MTRNSLNSQIFLAVVGLFVIIGIIQTVRHNFLGLLLMVTLAAVFILLFKRFAATRKSAEPGYQKALKRQQQQKKHSQHSPQQHTHKHSQSRSSVKKPLQKRSNRPNPFQVIEGQKGKKNNSGVAGDTDQESDSLK